MTEKVETIDSEHWRQVYNGNARLYTALAAGFHIFGIARQRRHMLDAMQLRPGDLAVDLCCGSGQNFADLQRRVGPQGRIIGVDISEGMLDVASDLVARKRWNNVDLVQANIFDYDLPENTSAALSTFGIDIIPDADKAVAHLAATMPDGSRLGLLGSKEPGTWPDWLVRFGIFLNRSMDIRREQLSIRPDLAAERLLQPVARASFWFGIFYWSVAVKN